MKINYTRISIIAITVLLVATLVILKDGKIGINNLFSSDSDKLDNQSQEITNEYYNHIDLEEKTSNNSDYIIFPADTGFLIKGKLLDLTYSEIYNQLPDTITQVLFGDTLYSASNQGNPTSSLDSEKRYSTKKINDHNKLLEKVDKKNILGQYLNLADQGKVEYLELLNFSYKSSTNKMINPYTYKKDIQKYFNSKIKWQKETPMAIKEVLMNYFNSEEGQQYDFVNDKRHYKKVFQLGTYTGNNWYNSRPKKELAIVLSPKSYTNKERLLVITYNNNSRKKSIIYNRVFHEKIILNTYSSPIELPVALDFFKDIISETQQLIEIKTQSGDHICLYYDAKFDQMQEKTIE